jgi:hypothetical protein
LNGKIFDPDVNGIDDCVRLYQKATTIVKNGSPPLLAHVIRNCNDKEEHALIKNPWAKTNLLFAKKAR